MPGWRRSRASAARPLMLALALLLAACASPGPAPEKRHSAAELQRYQPSDFRWAPAADAAERAMLADEQARQRARVARLQRGEAAALAELPAALASAAQFNLEIEALRAPLLAALPGVAQQAPDTQRALLTAAYALYAPAAAPLLWPLLPSLQRPREYAIAAYTLLKAQPELAGALRAQTEAQFPPWREEPRLRALMASLGPPAAARPPLPELLAAPLRPGYPVVFSLQRPSRGQLGLALVRGPDGRFVREPDGRLFAVPQLALSRSGLPGTISMGNTPQGLFTLRGAGTATNPWIGPTPYLHTMLPVEATPAEFEHAAGPALPQAQPWSEALYESFLPPAWAAYEPFKEAWLAGLAGRDEILMHGNTLNPGYYPGTAYAPAVPQAGCLVAAEHWDAADGRLLRSDQLRLAKAFTRSGAEHGYLAVVNLEDDGARAVTLDEVLPLVLQAEQKYLQGKN